MKPYDQAVSSEVDLWNAREGEGGSPLVVRILQCHIIREPLSTSLKPTTHNYYSCEDAQALAMPKM
jgi:hypothetical protein